VLEQEQMRKDCAALAEETEKAALLRSKTFNNLELLRFHQQVLTIY